MTAVEVQPLHVERLGHVNVYARSLAETLWLQRDVLGATVFDEWDMAGSGSRNALAVVGRTCIESFAPTVDDLEVGRSVARYGPGWHSLEWTVPSLADAAETVRRRGLRITEQTEHFLFTHPKDLHGVALELTESRFQDDPRDAAGYEPDEVTAAHPLGIHGRATVQVSAASPEAAEAAAQDVAALVGQGVEQHDHTHLGAIGYGLRFDDHAVEFVAPADAGAEGPVGTFARERGNRIFSVCFPVRELAAAQAHLTACGVAFDRLGDHSLLVGPAAGQGARIEFRAGR